MIDRLQTHFLVVSVLAIIFTTTAQAQYQGRNQLCNRGAYDVFVAFGAAIRGKVEANGFYEVKRDKCIVIKHAPSKNFNITIMAARDGVFGALRLDGSKERDQI